MKYKSVFFENFDESLSDESEERYFKDDFAVMIKLLINWKVENVTFTNRDYHYAQLNDEIVVRKDLFDIVDMMEYFIYGFEISTQPVVVDRLVFDSGLNPRAIQKNVLWTQLATIKKICVIMKGSNGIIYGGITSLNDVIETIGPVTFYSNETRRFHYSFEKYTIKSCNRSKYQFCFSHDQQHQTILAFGIDPVNQRGRLTTDLIVSNIANKVRGCWRSRHNKFFDVERLVVLSLK